MEESKTEEKTNQRVLIDLGWIATAIFFISVSSCTAFTHISDNEKQVELEKLRLEKLKIECQHNVE